MALVRTGKKQINRGAAAVFAAGAIATWIAFDTQPPADDVRTLAGYLGFFAMAAGCAWQIMRLR